MYDVTETNIKQRKRTMKDGWVVYFFSPVHGRDSERQL